MKSHSDDYVHPRTSYRDDEPPEINRKYSILPKRAVQDRKITLTELKVLGAICIHTNSHGIAWPSLTTLAKHCGLALDTVSRATTRLVRCGYIRKLQPRKYKAMPKIRGRRSTTRYQVLFEGKETPLPKYEDFYAPAPSFVAHHDGEPERTLKEAKGVQGVDKLMSLSLAAAFCKSVAVATGELRLADSQRDAADRLAAAGVTTDQVAKATAEAATEAQRRGSPAPQTLEQVAKLKGLI